MSHSERAYDATPRKGTVIEEGDVEMLYDLPRVWFDTQKPMKEMPSWRISSLWTEVWFAKGAKQNIVDSQLQRFQLLLDCNWTQHGCYAWQELGMLILYDQIPRNIFRGKPQAYAYDVMALQLAKRLLQRQETLPIHGKIAVIICFLHSENILDHQHIAEFAGNVTERSNLEPCVAKSLARMITCHYERVALFGRIPERNKFLCRTSTFAEKLYLQEVKHTVSS